MKSELLRLFEGLRGSGFMTLDVGLEEGCRFDKSQIGKSDRLMLSRIL
jgi:hypothetical protein